MLRRVRRLARLSQRDLAGIAGVPLATLTRIESGQVANPGIGTVAALVRAAGFHLEIAAEDTDGHRWVVAAHPHEGERDNSGRRFPAHVELVPVGHLWDGLTISWWAWAYKWSTEPGAPVPSHTYSLKPGTYFRPTLDPVTGAPVESGTLVAAVEQGLPRPWTWRPRNPHAEARRLAALRRRGSTMTRIGVFALQGDVREHVRALQSAGCEAVAVRRPAELDEVDGLVLPGGESTTMVKLARIFDLLDPLRRRIAEGMPVYGSCAGMILLADRVDTDGSPLAETIGGLDITVRRNAFGRQVDSFEEDVAIRGIAGDPVRAVFIRAPWVQDLGPMATALGTTAAGHVVAVRQGSLLATSFHPEMTGDGRVHAYFCAMVSGTEELPG